MKKITITTKSLEETIGLGEAIGRNLRGSEIVELVSDLGGGKTQLVRGLAIGAGSQDAVQSPSFTISRIYRALAFEVYHFDLHRLQEPGIIKHELQEVVGDKQVVTVIEWADHAKDILPADRLIISMAVISENERKIVLQATGPNHYHLVESIK